MFVDGNFVQQRIQIKVCDFGCASRVIKVSFQASQLVG